MKQESRVIILDRDYEKKYGLSTFDKAKLYSNEHNYTQSLPSDSLAYNSIIHCKSSSQNEHNSYSYYFGTLHSIIFCYVNKYIQNQ